MVHFRHVSPVLLAQTTKVLMFINFYITSHIRETRNLLFHSILWISLSVPAYYTKEHYIHNQNNS
jgi:hypothetical protein